MNMADDTIIKAPPPPTVEDAPEGIDEELPRRDSQTASEWVDSQLRLEADAREALPYSFDSCTRQLGALRQNVFACLTCHPPPGNRAESFTPAGICYGCSISCHGEHTLVEIFARRNFTCDCGTSRFPDNMPCSLRVNPATSRKGGVHGETPSLENDYNHNFRNRFCGCGDWYVAEDQKGTMYQCLGLASEAEGGCGEDWWHPECLLGLPKDWQTRTAATENKPNSDGKEDQPDEHPVPPGFPDEDDFESLICYKCVAAVPWIKMYADSPGFRTLSSQNNADKQSRLETPDLEREVIGVKRKMDEEDTDSVSSKRARMKDSVSQTAVQSEDAEVPYDGSPKPPKHAELPPSPPGVFSILTTTDAFRDNFCRCAECYPRLSKYPPLLEAEEIYQPPVSEDDDGAASQGTGSLLDRGEAALNAMDRVRAIEGVMAYNHLKDKVKAFLQPFAESGKVVGAEDVRKYFEQLRGDETAIREAGRQTGDENKDNEDTDEDHRREQSGY